MSVDCITARNTADFLHFFYFPGVNRTSRKNGLIKNKTKRYAKITFALRGEVRTSHTGYSFVLLKIFHTAGQPVFVDDTISIREVNQFPFSIFKSNVSA